MCLNGISALNQNERCNAFFFLTLICKLMRRLDFVVFLFNFFCYLNNFFLLFFSSSQLLSCLFFPLLTLQKSTL